MAALRLYEVRIVFNGWVELVITKLFHTNLELTATNNYLESHGEPKRV